MRYFKYAGPWPDMESEKKLYSDVRSLTGRRRRRAQWLDRLGTVVFWLVFVGGFAALVYLICRIKPAEEGVFGEILRFLGNTALSIIALIVSAIVGMLVATPLWERYRKEEETLMRAALHKACAALRDYYGLREPVLVTKCYQSSDPQWNRHDVCVFIVEDELRIAANLQYGFFHPRKDLGCYGLSRGEICLQNAQFKDRPAIELQAQGVTFLLGCKAQKYIQNQFLDKKSDLFEQKVT